MLGKELMAGEISTTTNTGNSTIGNTTPTSGSNTFSNNKVTFSQNIPKIPVCKGTSPDWADYLHFPPIPAALKSFACPKNTVIFIDLGN